MNIQSENEKIIKQVLENDFLQIENLNKTINNLRDEIKNYEFVLSKLRSQKSTIYNKTRLININNSIKLKIDEIYKKIKELDKLLYGDSIITKVYNGVKEKFLNLLCNVPVSIYKKPLDPISFTLSKIPPQNVRLLTTGAIVYDTDKLKYGTIINNNNKSLQIKFTDVENTIPFDVDKHKIINSFNIDQMLTKLKMDVTDENKQYINFTKGGLFLKKYKKKSNKKQKSIKNRTRTRYIYK
jgi:hypothetical protein